MNLRDLIPSDWQTVLSEVLDSPKFAALEKFLSEQYENHTVYPPREDLFTALRLTPYENVRVLILGQDPYHGAGQAHGLSFSVKKGITPPPSLKNIYKELKEDVDFKVPKHGNLTHWAEQGVLLLNAVLTVREAEPNSHANQGWEEFTDAIIQAVNRKGERVVFILWGSYARKKKKLIDGPQHVVLESGHPSPLSVKHFLGSRPFSRTNAVLAEQNLPTIDWQLPEG